MDFNDLYASMIHGLGILVTMRGFKFWALLQSNGKGLVILSDKRLYKERTTLYLDSNKESLTQYDKN